MKIELKRIISKKKEEQKKRVEVDDGIFIAKNALDDKRLLIANMSSDTVLVLGNDCMVMRYSKSVIPKVYHDIKQIKSAKIEFEVEE